MIKYEIGKTYDTPKGKVLILARVPGKRFKNGKRIHPRIVIQVKKTGTVLNIQTGNLGMGKFSDYMEPTVYGVGYIGSSIKIPQRETNSIVRRIYDMWANMLKRAYGDYRTCYKGVTVDPRWHSFTNFLNTIQEVENYMEWEMGHGFVLDKDIKHIGNKVYSKENCIFVPGFLNVCESSLRRWHGTNDSMLTNID